MKQLGRSTDGRGFIVELSRAELDALDRLAMACNGKTIWHIDEARYASLGDMHGPIQGQPIEHWVDAVQLFTEGLGMVSSTIVALEAVRESLKNTVADDGDA